MITAAEPIGEPPRRALKKISLNRRSFGRFTMSTPRHLWSGDWRLESVAAAEELARRRAELEDSPAPASAPPPPAPSLYARLVAALRRARARLASAGLPKPRQLRLAVLVAALALLAAGAVYGLTALIGSSSPSAALSGARPWLGLEMVSSPTGVIITAVQPGSPAEHSGIRPGDTVFQINNQPVIRPEDIDSTIAGMRAGDQVEIEGERGARTYTTQATLAPRPARYR
jgi:PDZ domain-containing protein